MERSYADALYRLLERSLCAKQWDDALSAAMQLCLWLELGGSLPNDYEYCIPHEVFTPDSPCRRVGVAVAKLATMIVERKRGK